MRKDGAFRIYEISCEIRPGKCRYGGVKKNKTEKSIISFSTRLSYLEMLQKHLFYT